jgi:hypothetical protein
MLELAIFLLGRFTVTLIRSTQFDFHQTVCGLLLHHMTELCGSGMLKLAPQLQSHSMAIPAMCHQSVFLLILHGSDQGHTTSPSVSGM